MGCVGSARGDGPARVARSGRACRRVGHRRPGAPAGRPPGPGDEALGDLHHRPAAAVGPPPAPAPGRAGRHCGCRARVLLGRADPARCGRPAPGPRHRPPAHADVPTLRPLHPRRPARAGLDRDLGRPASAGGRSVDGVLVRGPDGVERAVAVEAVVFSGDFIPDNELARLAGLVHRSGHQRSGLRGRRRARPPRGSSPPATSCTRPRRRTWRRDAPAPSGGRSRRGCVQGDERTPAPSTVRVRVADPLLWVVPNVIGPSRERDRAVPRQIAGLPRSSPARGDPGWPAPGLAPSAPHDPEPLARPAVRLAAARRARGGRADLGVRDEPAP